MDWRKISKAVGGGVAAAVGGVGTAAIAIPAEVLMPWYGYVIVGVANAALGFATVYWFPQNSAGSREA